MRATLIHIWSRINSVPGRYKGEQSPPLLVSLTRSRSPPVVYRTGRDSSGTGSLIPFPLRRFAAESITKIMPRDASGRCCISAFSCDCAPAAVHSKLLSDDDGVARPGLSACSLIMRAPARPGLCIKRRAEGYNRHYGVADLDSPIAHLLFRPGLCINGVPGGTTDVRPPLGPPVTRVC